MTIILRAETLVLERFLIICYLIWMTVCFIMVHFYTHMLLIIDTERVHALVVLDLDFDEMYLDTTSSDYDWLIAELSSSVSIFKQFILLLDTLIDKFSQFLKDA